MSDRRGFTLIELLIVVSILGLLASIAVPKVREAKAKAAATQVVGAIRAIRIAATIYYDSAGTWPPSASLGSIPPGLAGYLPQSVKFTNSGYRLRWQRVTIAGGGTQGRVQARTSDPLLCAPLGHLLGGPSATLTVSCGASNGRVTTTIDR